MEGSKSASLSTLMVGSSGVEATTGGEFKDIAGGVRAILALAHTWASLLAKRLTGSDLTSASGLLFLGTFALEVESTKLLCEKILENSIKLV
jgi:hypothetical protein